MKIDRRGDALKINAIFVDFGGLGLRHPLPTEPGLFS